MKVLYIPQTKQTARGHLGYVTAFTFNDENELICQRLYATAGTHDTELDAITAAQEAADRCAD